MFGFSKLETFDEEKGSVLYPGLSAEENQLRWGFIRKVYGILGTQLLLTAAVAAGVVLYRPATVFFVNTPVLFFFIAILPLILICPLYYYREKHPVNLALLGLFTVTLSLSVGIACAFTSGTIVLEALILTAAVVVSLTGYSYWASRKGYDLTFLGPILFTCLIVLILFGFIQAFFPLGPISTMIYAGLGSLLFSAYIVYDTHNLIKRFTYDEYIWASVVLYLDILNLFLYLLDLLRATQSR